MSLFLGQGLKAVGWERKGWLPLFVSTDVTTVFHHPIKK